MKLREPNPKTLNTEKQRNRGTEETEELEEGYRQKATGYR
jgi:hypothetical protein